MKPGIHTLTGDQYHADQIDDQPTLSASIASVLCSSSPAHARAKHPRLNPDFERVHDEKFDIGNTAHAVMLEGRDAVEIVNADDWRTAAAKEARQVAREYGRIALLARQYDEVQAMIAAVRVQLDAHNARPPLFTDGQPERTIVWEEDGGVVCRARLDWIRDDLRAIDDLKTTSRSANPEAYSRALFGVGGDVQAAFYLRGLERLTGARAEFRWVVVETALPYALSVISPGPDVLTLGAKKVAYAIDVWRRCLANDEWPGYEPRVAYAELPPWEESRWLERELREVAA